MQMKIQVHKSLLVSFLFFSRSFLFFFTQEQYEQLMRQLHKCISVQMTDDRRRNEYTCCAWAGGTFFQLCCCVSFWFWREIGFGFTYLFTQSTIQLWVCVSFLVLAENSFWCFIRTQCTIQLCGCVSFLVVAGNSSQNENTFLQKNPIGLLYHDLLADVCIS